MAFVCLTENSRGRSLPVHVNDDISVSIVSRGQDTGWDIAIRISDRLMKSQRLLIGDKLHVYYDDESDTYMIKRTQSQGYAITPATAREKGKASESIGKCIRGMIRLPQHGEKKLCKNDITGACTDIVELEDGGVTFKIQKTTV